MNAATTTVTIECQACNGKGSYTDMVYWSDGPGMAEHRCPLCDGTGQVDDNPAALAIRYKEELAALQQQHRRFVISTALYLKTSRGQMPDPPFVVAPSPSSYPEHHLEVICKEVKKLPRLERGSHEHGDEVCRQNIEKYPTSYLDSTCRASLGMPQRPASR